MHHIYLWLGAAMFWTIIAALTWIVIRDYAIPFWYKIRQRTWGYQVYEYFHFKRVVKKHYQDNFVKTSWTGVRWCLNSFAKPRFEGYRKKHLFRNKISNMLAEMLIHQPNSTDVVYMHRAKLSEAN
jgi:hypothetical protein